MFSSTIRRPCSLSLPNVYKPDLLSKESIESVAARSPQERYIYSVLAWLLSLHTLPRWIQSIIIYLRMNVLTIDDLVFRRKFFVCLICLFVCFSMWQYFLNLILSNMRLILSKQIQRHRQKKTNEKPALIHCFCRKHVKPSVVYFSFPVKISAWCEVVKQVYAKVNKLFFGQSYSSNF